MDIKRKRVKRLGLIIILPCLILLVLIIIIATHLQVYKTKPFDRNVLTGETQKITASSSSDFLRTGAGITVQAIHSGDLELMLSNPIDLNHPAFKDIEDKKVTVPVFAYYLKHEKYGTFLIDSGSSADYIDNPYGTMDGLLAKKLMVPTYVEDGMAIEQQLTDVIGDIKGVFFTHLHFDHTSGVPALPDNLLFFAGKGELSVNIQWLLEANHFNNNDTMNLFDFNAETAEDMELGKSIDVFGDGSLWAISTPGHSKGHVAYLVNTADAPILIAGDACITNDCLKYGAGSGTSAANTDESQKTAERIKEFEDKNPTVQVWCGHDFPTSFVEYSDASTASDNKQMS